MNKLINLYDEIADLTGKYCSAGCRGVTSVFRCCDKRWCEESRIWALQQYNITLEDNDYGIMIGIPFMGLMGCTVPAYLRPTCSMHGPCPFDFMESKDRERKDQLIDLIKEEEIERMEK